MKLFKSSPYELLSKETPFSDILDDIRENPQQYDNVKNLEKDFSISHILPDLLAFIKKNQEYANDKALILEILFKSGILDYLLQSQDKEHELELKSLISSLTVEQRMKLLETITHTMNHEKYDTLFYFCMKNLNDIEESAVSRKSMDDFTQEEVEIAGFNYFSQKIKIKEFYGEKKPDKLYRLIPFRNMHPNQIYFNSKENSMLSHVSPGRKHEKVSIKEIFPEVIKKYHTKEDANALHKLEYLDFYCCTKKATDDFLERLTKMTRDTPPPNVIDFLIEKQFFYVFSNLSEFKEKGWLSEDQVEMIFIKFTELHERKDFFSPIHDYIKFYALDNSGNYPTEKLTNKNLRYQTKLNNLYVELSDKIFAQLSLLKERFSSKDIKDIIEGFMFDSLSINHDVFKLDIYDKHEIKKLLIQAAHNDLITFTPELVRLLQEKGLLNEYIKTVHSNLHPPFESSHLFIQQLAKHPEIYENLSENQQKTIAEILHKSCSKMVFAHYDKIKGFPYFSTEQFIHNFINSPHSYVNISYIENFVRKNDISIPKLEDLFRQSFEKNPDINGSEFSKLFPDHDDQLKFIKKILNERVTNFFLSDVVNFIEKNPWAKQLTIDLKQSLKIHLTSLLNSHANWEPICKIFTQPKERFSLFLEHLENGEIAEVDNAICLDMHDHANIAVPYVEKLISTTHISFLSTLYKTSKKKESETDNESLKHVHILQDTAAKNLQIIFHQNPKEFYTNIDLFEFIELYIDIIPEFASKSKEFRDEIIKTLRLAGPDYLFKYRNSLYHLLNMDQEEFEHQFKRSYIFSSSYRLSDHMNRSIDEAQELVSLNPISLNQLKKLTHRLPLLGMHRNTFFREFCKVNKLENLDVYEAINTFQKIQLLYPFFQDEIEKCIMEIHKKDGKTDILSDTHIVMNRKFEHLNKTCSILSSSPYAQHFYDELSRLPDDKRKKFIDTAFTFCSLGLDTFTPVNIPPDSNLEIFLSKSNNKFFYEAFDMNTEDISEYSEISQFNTQGILQYMQQHKTSKKLMISFKECMRHALQGDFLIWRQWNISSPDYNPELVRAYYANIQKLQLLPQSFTLEQYEKWCNTQEISISRILELSSSSVNKGIKEMLSNAIQDNHITLENDLSSLHQVETALSEITSQLKSIQDALDKAKESNDKALYETLQQEKTEFIHSHIEERTKLEAHHAFFKLQALADHTIMENKNNIIKYARKLASYFPDADFVSENIEQAIFELTGEGKVSKQDLIITDEIDFNTYFEIGQNPVPSCQSYQGGSLNYGLVSYIADPQIRVLHIKTKDTGMLVSRAIMRIMQDENGNPVLFMERIYTTNFHEQITNAMMHFAKEKAEKIGIPFLYARDQSIITSLFNYASRSPFNYSDASGGLTDPYFTITPGHDRGA